jgi:predicted peptidase
MTRPKGLVLCVVLLFVLLDVRAESPVVRATPNAFGAPRREQQHGQVFEGQTTHAFRISYLLFLPIDYEKNAKKRWPLLLYLHGGSLRGNDIESVRKLGLPHKLETDPNFPFVVVSPQCPAGEIWTDVEALGALLDRIQADYRIDSDQAYATGHSMGGRGALYLVYRQPERFAAVVALSPLSPIVAWKDNLAKLPVWILHGKNDTLAPVPDTQELVVGIESAGGHARLDILPDRDHFILDVYDRPEIYKWLLRQKRGAGAQR